MCQRFFPKQTCDKRNKNQIWKARETTSGKGGGRMGIIALHWVPMGAT